MLYKLLLLFFLGCSSGVVFACKHKAIEPHAKVIGVNCESMYRILASIDTHVRLAQEKISEIASSDTPYSQKDSLIRSSLHRHYASDHSTIQVTSINSEIPRYYNISTYLYNLAKLSREKYNTVKLIYYREYAKLSSMDRISDNSYSFNIETFQRFTGCKTNDGINCYNDVTKKIFHAILTKEGDSANKYNIKINKISATDTYSYEDFKTRMDILLR